MARIRSIHPGLFTDEAFMTASAHARLLIIGVWCEAWDDGVFEWKPLTLKARLFPADVISVSDLLGELAGLDFVRQFDADGKAYGVIRNFQKYQRPKKPNSSGKLPNDLGKYACSDHRNPEPVPHQAGTDGEKSAQREDGGGREGVGENEDTASAASSAGAPAVDMIDAERRCQEAAGTSHLGKFAPIEELLHRKADLELDILPVIRARKAAAHGVKSWKWYVPSILEAMVRRAPSTAPSAAPKVFVKAGSAEWHARVAAGHKPGLISSYPEHGGEGWLFPASAKTERAA
jgi:hypothetical protein